MLTVVGDMMIDAGVCFTMAFCLLSTQQYLFLDTSNAIVCHSRVCAAACVRSRAAQVRCQYGSYMHRLNARDDNGSLDSIYALRGLMHVMPGCV